MGNSRRFIIFGILLHIFMIITLLSMEQENKHPDTPDPRLLTELPGPAEPIVNEYIGQNLLQQQPSLTQSDLVRRYATGLPRLFIQQLYNTIQSMRKNQVIIYNNTPYPFDIHATAAPNLRDAALSCYINYFLQNIIIEETYSPGRAEFNLQRIPNGESYSFAIPPQCIANNLTYVGVCAHSIRVPEVFDKCYVPVSAKGTILELVRKNYGLGLSRRIQLLNTLSTLINAKVYKIPLLSPSYFEYFERDPYSTLGPAPIDPHRQRDLNLFIPFYALNNFFFPKPLAQPNPKALVIRLWDHEQATRKGFDAVSTSEIRLNRLFPFRDVSTDFNVVQTYDDKIILDNGNV